MNTRKDHSCKLLSLPSLFFMRRGGYVFGLAVSVCLFSAGCARKPVEGPDKVFSGQAVGALEGAGAGAVTGVQIGASAGPAAAVGAGLGAVVGAIHGMVRDANDEAALRTEREIQGEKEIAEAQSILADHYKRRLALHPSRDIFPADLFFSGDSIQMCPRGISVVNELAKMNELRLPYSRLVVAVYAKSVATDSEYAQHLTERRAKEFANYLIRAGVEPRRIQTRSVVVDAPVLIDPLDNPLRYNQAIEIIPVDR